MSWIKSTPSGCLLTIKATPRASRSEVAGVEGVWLRVRLQAPPVDGKANAALVEFLAGILDVRRRDVTLVAGEKARIKQVHVAGVSAEAVRGRLGFA